MRTVGPFQSEYSLEEQGILNLSTAYWNLSTPHLYELAIRRREGNIAHLGPLVVRTGSQTGRSPNDKFIVREPSSEANIHWGKVNKAMEPEQFERLKLRLFAYMQSKDLFVQDCFAGADPEYRMPIRILTEYAWHNLFARNLFIQAKPDELKNHRPEFTVIDAPNFRAIPEIDGTRSETFIVMNFAERTVLIGGTQYAGEMKKSIFTALNYILPLQSVLPMHCSANVGPEGDVAVFFGLSGTGKTTLSADPSRKLIGDDEHGWSDQGIFNFEGGCYAKIIRLSRQSEPEIYETTRRFGTVLENVGFNLDTGRIDLNDDSLTENTRAAYPISHIPNAELSGLGTHPKNIIMLTADAFGVMPPIARLSPEQAMYQFLSGYTAKVAGTERGVTEPQATFSTCFGAPFMVHIPTVYASLLGDRIQKHQAKVWLVNTGWTGGPYGVGSRFKIEYTRAMINAALSGALDNVQTTTDPFFGLDVPNECPGVPNEVLNPRGTWKNGEEYDRQALRLASMFEENFRQFADTVSEDVRNAGPKAG